MNYAHVSVLLREAVEALVPRRGGVFVDCTAGGGGHSEEILRQTPHGARLISLDQDERAVVRCRQRLAAYGTASTVVKANFAAVGEVLDGLGIQEIDGVLWDLGVSSVQLDEAERGFSYMAEAPLDMPLAVERRLILSILIVRKSCIEFYRIMEKSDFPNESLPLL